MMDNDKIAETKEKRIYIGKRASDIVNLPQIFRRNALSPKNAPGILNTPMTAFRIIFKILNDVSNDQFVPIKQPEQLRLFAEDFMTEDNTYARFTFSVSDIDKHKDYKQITKGLEFLELLNKKWYKSANSTGKMVKTQFGVITAPSITEGKISFLMASYWLKQILAMDHYNRTYYRLAWEFKEARHFLIYLWVLELKEKGTTVSFQSFQESLGYNFKAVKEFNRNVLKKVKSKLDKEGNVSFNYTTKNDKISIVPYTTLTTKSKKREKTVTNQEITQKTNYWKLRHGLTNDQAAKLKEAINRDISLFHVFKNAYKLLVLESREKKINTDSYEGDDFLNIYQEKIIQTYKASAWGESKFAKAYPKIK